MSDALEPRRPYLPPPPTWSMLGAVREVLARLTPDQRACHAVVTEALTNADLLPPDITDNPDRFFVDGAWPDVGSSVDLVRNEWSNRPQTAPPPAADLGSTKIAGLSAGESLLARFALGAVVGAVGAATANYVGRDIGRPPDPRRDSLHVVASGLFGGMTMAMSESMKPGLSAASHTPSSEVACSLASIGRAAVSLAESRALEAAFRLMRDGRNRVVVWRHVTNMKACTRWTGIGRYGVGGTLELVLATRPSGAPSFSLLRDQIELYRDPSAAERLRPMAELWESGMPVDSIGDQYVCLLLPHPPSA